MFLVIVYFPRAQASKFNGRYSFVDSFSNLGVIYF
jgi:hypothetical protein